LNASFVALRELPWASRKDSTPVCLERETVLDFGAFKARMSMYAGWIEEQAGRRIAVCLDDSFEFACALFAVLACGREPIIPSTSTPAYLTMLGPCYDVLLTAAQLPAVDVRAAGPLLERSIDARAPMTLYTSGSSGVPKAVHKTLAQFDAEVRTLETQWGSLIGQAPILASVPHRHIYGLLFRVFWPLAAGRPFDRDSCAEPLQLQARLDRVGSAAVVSSPSQLDRWTELPGFDTLSPSPCVYFSSGGPLSEETADTYARRFGAAPVEIYGSTETGGIAWRRRDRSDAWQAVPGAELKCDTDGALLVRSPHLGHEDWHRTDDAVAFDEAGRFRLKGRLDRVVKLDGKRVSLPEIETHLARHPYVAQAAVVVLPGAVRERLGALIALSREGCAALLADGRVALAKALRAHLGEYVEAVVLPRRWRFCSALPFDARGKLPAAEVAAAFDVRPQGMEVLAQFAHEDALHYELRVPANLVHFAGHFPGLPILPGVVQIDWAVQLGAEHWPEVRSMLAIERLKFMAPVPPGAILHLTLARDAVRRKMRFAFRLGERDSASGIVAYQGAA
jgi:acyl-coenzyme A synthetase/AMP-(fatty) acid ligase/3-hydroxymyristoyl/3-hydroxydecanoyl-(acyl carrier protein) dehydratase